MSFRKTITLNNGVELPQIGLGTWQSAPGEVEAAVKVAIETGYRHIDAAVIYGNQLEVAEGIKQAGVAREELFLVSKLWNNSHRPELVEADLDNTLTELGTDYLDLYLIHWPVPFLPGKTLSATKSRDDGNGEEVAIDVDAPSITETWNEMGRLLKETKKVRAIGVSNFTITHIEKLINATGIVPAVNQIEAHPLLVQQDLIDYCAKKNIHITAYSPLGQNITGRPPVIAHPTVAEIATKTVAWGVSMGYSVIPKSVTPSRIKSNFEQVELKAEDLQAITDLVKTEGRTRYNVPVVYNPRWNISVFGEEEEKVAPISVW